MKYTRRILRAVCAVPDLRPSQLCLVLLALLVAGGWVLSAAAAEELPEQKLEALKKKIGRLEERIREDTRARRKESEALRRSEKAAAAAAAALEKTRQARQASAQRLAQLGEREKELESALARDSRALEGEVRAAWLAGSQPRVKLALSQQDPASLGRMLAWYGYLARDRAARIGAARQRLAELVDLRAEIDGETRRLAEIETRQAEELRREQAARQDRGRAVAELDAVLAKSGAQIDVLREEAEVLERLIEDLRAAIVDLPVPESGPFAAQRGRLSWPVSGGIARDFGERKGGGPRSSGVLLAATRGAEVRSVWTGRVAYADWLPGLGLLLIVDHGDGYMSLYGHNEVLFKTVGDWVAAGEVVARAGDTGGREQAGLYFEIRKGREPQNPHKWFSSRRGRAR